MTQVIGIVNLTPDSFSDGGRYADPEAAFAHMAHLVEEGADVLDIGAESTRPGAILLSHEEEWQRLSPVLHAARQRFPNTLLSVDTRHGATAEKALELGVDWINDVSGGADPRMAGVIAAFPHASYVLMHSLGVPPSAQHTLPQQADVVEALRNWLEEKRRVWGCVWNRVIFDIGLGFGKTVPQNWQLLQQIDALQALHSPLLVGHSRKSFFGRQGDGTAVARDLETHAVTAYLAAKSVAYLRVHDVAGARRAIAVGQALKGQEK